MEPENQHNEQTETSTEDTNTIQSEVDTNVVNQTDEEMDNDEVVLLVDGSSKRLDKQNLKKLKKMSDTTTIKSLAIDFENGLTFLKR